MSEKCPKCGAEMYDNFEAPASISTYGEAYLKVQDVMDR